MSDKDEKDDVPKIDLNLKIIKKDLIKEFAECSKRCLKHSTKWISEFISSIEVDLDLDEDDDDFKIESFKISDMKELETYTLAKSYIDLEEYLRAAYVSRNSSPEQPSFFIGIYARYLDAETKSLDTSHDMLSSIHNDETRQLLSDIRNDLLAADKNNSLDGYCLYLYGIVLLRLSLNKESINVLCRALTDRPLLWAAWNELSKLVKDVEEVQWLSLPDNWVKHIFLGLVNSELHHNVTAIQIFEDLQNSGLAHSSYIQAQLALGYYNIRDLDNAEQLFAQLHKFDPHRIDNMDSYSNILFVKNNTCELGVLAHRCMQTQKFREETCCIIGNFYSLRSDHDKALLYFQRALKLNPSYHVAWTLVGHELMELKNFNGAIHAYRQSVEKCPQDFKSWYGLGQAYEIINMTSYSIYFYRKAQMLRPNDARMIMPLADAYMKLGQLQSAKKCYLRAHYVRDDNGMALIKLAGLCEKMGNTQEAAAAYTEYLYINPDGKMSQDEYCIALKFLANYHLNNGDLNEAEAAAYKCSLLAETKYEAKVLLNQIASLRLIDDSNHSLDMGSPNTEQSPTSSIEFGAMDFSDDMNESRDEEYEINV